MVPRAYQKKLAGYAPANPNLKPTVTLTLFLTLILFLTQCLVLR